MNNIIKSAVIALGMTIVMPLTATVACAQCTDRETYNLKGKVKTVRTNLVSRTVYYDGPTPYHELNFDINGKLTKAYSYADLKPTDYASANQSAEHFITRDAKGRISSYNDQQRAVGSKTKRMVKKQTVKITYDANNRVTSSTTYLPALNTKRAPVYCSYDSKGNVIKAGKSEITILETDSHGNWTTRKLSDSVFEEKRTITYWEDDSKTESKKVSTGSEKVYDVVNGTMPSFPGGKTALQNHIAQNLTYPPTAVENKIEGKVIVSFIVTKDGSISNATVVKSVDPSLDKEAVRVVTTMPKWTPGTNDGQPVNVKYMMPITFKL